MSAENGRGMGDLAEILEPGQILLVSRSGVFPEIIKRVTHSPWTHAALIDHNAGGVWIAVEAIRPGPVGTRLEHYFEDPHYTAMAVLEVPALSWDQRLRVLQTAWLQVGQGYDLWGTAGIAVKRSLGWAIGNQMDAQGRKFCSELVSFAHVQGAGMDLVPGEPDGQTAPGDLYLSPVVRKIWEWPT